MSKLTILVLLLALFNTGESFAQKFIPSTIYQLDQRFSHHVLVVEKSTHTLYLYEYAQDVPKLIKTYQVATGKIKGDKLVQGDEKTPEGIYHFQNFRSSEDLIGQYGDETGKIYGAGAFTLNYPNEMDRRARKTGGGIWLHSTDDDARVSKGLDSRGCVVAIDQDLKEISQYIDLSNTPAIIVQDLHFLSEQTWRSNKEEILQTVQNWMKAWQEKNFKTYIQQYSKSEFYDRRKGNWNDYRRYKKAVFSRKDSPIIKFRNLSILSNRGYVVVTMEQDYSSDVIDDIGKKTLYLKQDENYEWKIVAELFNKLEKKETIAFTPSMRFFNDKVSRSNAEEKKANAESI